MSILTELLMGKDDILPDNFYEFSLIQTSINGCQADLEKPLYLALGEENHNWSCLFSQLIITQEPTVEDPMARFFTLYKFTSPLVEILKSDNPTANYRLQLWAENLPTEDKFLLFVRVYITREFLHQIYDNSITTPSIIAGLILEGEAKTLKLEVEESSQVIEENTSYSEDRTLQANYRHQPYPHQVSNIHWMNDREIAIDAGLIYETFALLHNDRYYRVKSLDSNLILDGNKQLVHPQDRESVKLRPRGGILADSVGLGKTLSCLGLIAESSVRQEGATTNRTTLVLCPPRLAKQWKEEAERFTHLRVDILSSIIQFRKKTAEKISELDILIVPYTFLMNTKYQQERLERLAKGSSQFLLDTYQWKRIILDEGHEINLSRKAETSGLLEEIKRIPSDYRWVVSGTPFPDLRRGSVIRSWIYHDSITWESGIKNERTRLRHFYGTLNRALYRRHTQESLAGQISIPSPQVRTDFLDMTQIERLIYDSALEDRDKQIELCNHIKVSEHHLNVLGNEPMTLIEIHEKMTNYYQRRVKWFTARIKNIKSAENSTGLLMEANTCGDGVHDSFQEVPQDEAILDIDLELGGAHNTEENQSKLETLESELAQHSARLKIFQSLQEKVDETDTCPICLDDFANTTKVVTKCGHFVCGGCVQSMFKGRRGGVPCHICRHRLIANDLEVIQPLPDTNVEGLKEDKVNQWGTKMARLISYLETVLETVENRVIIFSQWNNMLKLVGKVLSESGVEHLFLHGSIHVVSSRIRRFKLNPNIRVVLLSSDRASSGLNLTEASHIVLLDTLNTDRDSARVIEEQAIGRSVRLGQEKRVQVQRFIMRETIEHEFYLRNIGHMVNREVEPHGDTD